MKEENSPVEPCQKNKISNFGTFFLYTQISFTTLSLSIWRRTKVRKEFTFVDCPIICFWHSERVYICSKGIYVFSFYHVVYVVTSCFLSSFYLPYVILLRIVLLIPKVSHGKPELPTTTILILLRLKPIGSTLPLSRGRKKAAWWVCDSVKFGTPCQRRSVWS